MAQEGLGKYIREQREPFSGLREFARELEMSASYLSDIELGKRHVSKDMVMRLCVSLGGIIDGNIHGIHRVYDTMLTLSGHISRERIWLLSFRDSTTGTPLLEVLAPSMYTALYEELDVAIVNRTAPWRGDRWIT